MAATKKIKAAPKPPEPPAPPKPLTEGERLERCLFEATHEIDNAKERVADFARKVADAAAKGEAIGHVLRWKAEEVFEAEGLLRELRGDYLPRLLRGDIRPDMNWEERIGAVREDVDRLTDELTRDYHVGRSTCPVSNVESNAHRVAKARALAFLRKLLRLMEKPAVPDAAVEEVK